jgi:hypothetical protein
VKACNNIAFIHLLTLARPAVAPDRSALPIAGDDPGARRPARAGVRHTAIGDESARPPVPTRLRRS